MKYPNVRKCSQNTVPDKRGNFKDDYNYTCSCMRACKLFRRTIPARKGDGVLQASNVVCGFGSVLSATAGAVCEICSVSLLLILSGKQENNGRECDGKLNSRPFLINYPLSYPLNR